MKTEQKIYAAVAVLALASGGLYLSKQQNKAALEKHSSSAATADLPNVTLPKDDIEKLTKLEIKNADKPAITLEKKGEEWEVTAPVAAKANASNVRSLLDNLKDLKAKESIGRDDSLYAQYELTADKGVHFVAYKGADKALDLYFGKSGSRGQMARVADKPGVFIAGGYSSYLYTREVKNWRETSILKFEDANVVQASITNKNGLFSFSKNGDKWAASFKKRGKDGKLAAEADKKWDKFDEGKVKDFLRAYKALNAEDFAEDKADTGLGDAEKEGGVVHIKLKDNAGDLTIKVGKTGKGASRYALKEGGDGTVYLLSSWSADWATAERSKFEKAADGKAADSEAEPPAMGMPGMDMPDMGDDHAGHGH